MVTEKRKWHETKFGNWLKKYKWQLLTSLLIITNFLAVMQIQTREKNIVELSNRLEKSNYTVAMLKDNKQITAVDVLNNLMLSDEVKQSLKQSLIQNISNKNYKDTVTKEQLNNRLKDQLFSKNMTETEYLKLMQKSKKQLFQDWTKDLALTNALVANTDVSKKEINDIQNKYRENNKILIAAFNSKENAEAFRNDLLAKKQANYTLNQQTVTNLIKQANGLINNRYIEKTLANYNDLFPVTVNDQIWQTKENEPSIVISNNDNNALLQKYYVVFPLKINEPLKNPTPTQKRKIIEITKRVKLMDQKEVIKAADALLNDSDIQYRRPWSEVIK